MKKRRCTTGKQRHEDSTGAMAHLRSHFEATGEWLEVYRCKLCGGGWHIGHPPCHKPMPKFPPYEEWCKTLPSAKIAEKQAEKQAEKTQKTQKEDEPEP